MSFRLAGMQTLLPYDRAGLDVLHFHIKRTDVKALLCQSSHLTCAISQSPSFSLLNTA